MNTYDERVAKYGGSPKPPPRIREIGRLPPILTIPTLVHKFPALQRAGASRQQKLP